MAAKGREVRYTSVEVRELEAGNRTPWYEVSGAPVEDENVSGWYSVEVVHFVDERRGHIHQRGVDTVPVELT